jgi:hypothetical protein PPSC2_p0363
MEEKKEIGYLASPNFEEYKFEHKDGKEFDSLDSDFFRYGYSVFRSLLDLIAVTDISIHTYRMVECSKIDKVHSDPLHISCKHIKIIKEITIEDIAENIDDYRNDLVENMVTSCNKKTFGKIINYEDRSTIFMKSNIGVVNNSGMFCVTYLDGINCDCNNTSNSNIVVSNGKSNRINSSHTNNTFILREEDNTLSVTGGFNNIISTGKNNNISCISVSNRIMCNGGNNIVYLYGNNNSIKATVGTTIIYSERNSENEKEPATVKTFYIDGINIKPDTWYIIENGEIKECDK